MKEKLIISGYKKSRVIPGIVHIGVGNFHRAHQAFYIDKLLKDKTQQNWGICGICLLPQDEKIVKSMKKQNNNYTLTVCGRNGSDTANQISSITDIIWAIEEPEKAISQLADKNTKIITLTITEGGYNIDKLSGDFIFDNEDVLYDLKNSDNPKTVFGYIAAGLRLRMKNNAGPVTILTCDNLQHNGDTAKYVFSSFIKRQDEELYVWLAKNVSFPNSMVDRITPVTTAEDVNRLNEENQTNDEIPVYCEDFIQWVIEDNFIAGRPTLENVGVEFTEDVAPFENMKLSLLNASHTLLAYPSYLAGYRKVDEAMRDSRFELLLRNFMDIDITPYVPKPGGIDLEVYKQTLIERFGNKSVSDQISRLCADGASKYPVYIMPNLIKMIEDNKDMHRMAFSLASYRHYLKYKVDDKGNSFEINDPWLTENDLSFINSDNPLDFLKTSVFQKGNLVDCVSFVELYRFLVEKLQTNKIMSVLEFVLAIKKN